LVLPRFPAPWRKLESLAVFCLRDPAFSRFSRTSTCDRQTDRHDDISDETKLARVLLVIV